MAVQAWALLNTNVLLTIKITNTRPIALYSNSVVVGARHSSIMGDKDKQTRASFQ